MIQPIAKQTFEAVVGLSEAEVRVLAWISGYQSGITKAIKEHVTEGFDDEVLTELLTRWQDEMASCVRKFDAARDAIEGNSSPGVKRA